MTRAGPASDFAPMAGPILWTTGVLLALANFMVVLDTTIANVSVPNIAGGLAVSPNQGTWVITSYSVAEAITVPLTGWLAQRFGAVRVFAVAMVMFGVFSALCGLAPSFGALVALRVLQGLSGGPMIPLSQTLLRRVFPAHLQSTALGIWGMTTVVGPIAGPLLGGILVDSVGWPWVFFINVPVALICAFFVWRLLASRETEILRRPVDGVGLGLLVLWVGSLQIMLDKGKDLDWFQSPVIVALAIVAALGFVSFILWELTDEDPVVDLRVFRHPGFAASTIIMCGVFGTYFSSVVLIPLWLQTNMGYTATWAGRATAFQGMLAVVMSPVVARLTTRVDSRLLVCFGVLVLAGVSLWRTQFASNISFWGVAMPQLVQGFGVPFFFVALSGLALSSVNPRETASAAGLINFCRTTAAAFAVSITTTAWEDTTTTHRTDLAGALNHPGAAIDSLTAGGMSASEARGQLDALVQSQAVMLATDHIFLISALLFLACAALVWLAPKPRGMAPAGAGGH